MGLGDLVQQAIHAGTVVPRLWSAATGAGLGPAQAGEALLVSQAALRVAGHDADVDRLEDRARQRRPLLGVVVRGGERGLRLHALGDVARGRVQLDDASPLVADRGEPDLQ